MTLRKLKSQDLVEYRRLRLRSVETDPNAFFLRFSQAKKYPDSFFLSELLEKNTDTFGFYGTFEDMKLVGMISLQPLGGSKAQIFTLYVDPLYRGKGIGRMLLDEVLVKASQSAIESIKLTVIAGNTAIALYESIGFKLVGENKKALHNDSGGFDELVFQKELS